MLVMLLCSKTLSVLYETYYLDEQQVRIILFSGICSCRSEISPQRDLLCNSKTRSGRSIGRREVSPQRELPGKSIITRSGQQFSFSLIERLFQPCPLADLQLERTAIVHEYNCTMVNSPDLRFPTLSPGIVSILE